MFNWFKRPIPQPPLIIPPGEGQLCIQCGCIFSWRALRKDGECPACPSKQIWPISHFLEEESALRKQQRERTAKVAALQQKKEASRQRMAEIRGRMKVTDNISYLLTSPYEPPLPIRKSKPESPPEAA